MLLQLLTIGLDCIALCSIVFFNVLRWIVLLQSDGEEP